MSDNNYVFEYAHRENKFNFYIKNSNWNAIDLCVPFNFF